MLNPYQVLGLATSATAAEVKKAYRRLAQQLHPDRNKAMSAEAKFKEVQAAYELIASGKWSAPATAPAPAPEPYSHRDFHNAGYIQQVTIRATFKDTFVGTLIQVPGTPFVVKPPYGCTPWSTHRMTGRTLDQRHQDIFEVTWDIYDPNGFYTTEVIDGKRHLSCRVIVSAAQMLAGAEVVLANINPQASSLKLNLTAADLIRVPHAGLATGSGRGDLYVHVGTIYKDLVQERYDVLLELKAKVDKALASSPQRMFS